MRKRTQFPGKPFTFVRALTGEKDTGILPSKYGESNDFAMWNSDAGRPTRGSWISRRLNLKSKKEKRQGVGPNGLLDRMKALIRDSKQNARRSGHVPVKASAENLMDAWNLQEGLCAACRLPLNLFQACYDHNHETGKGRGFIHYACNNVEGILKNMPRENRGIFLEWLASC
jgi:hypothetical protein